MNSPKRIWTVCNDNGEPTAFIWFPEGVEPTEVGGLQEYRAVEGETEAEKGN